MSARHRVLVADDDALLRSSLAELVGSDAGLELVAVAVSVLVVALFVKRLDGNVVILIATVSAATLATVLLRRKNTANGDGTP